MTVWVSVWMTHQELIRWMSPRGKGVVWSGSYLGLTSNVRTRQAAASLTRNETGRYRCLKPSPTSSRAAKTCKHRRGSFDLKSWLRLSSVFVRLNWRWLEHESLRYGSSSSCCHEIGLLISCWENSWVAFTCGWLLRFWKIIMRLTS